MKFGDGVGHNRREIMQSMKNSHNIPIVKLAVRHVASFRSDYYIISSLLIYHIILYSNTFYIITNL